MKGTGHGLRKKATGVDYNSRNVSLYQVPLVCGAAPHIGCGGKSKPVLLELEAHNDIAEAWLNRTGTVMALVWENSSGSASRKRIASAVFKKNKLDVEELKGGAHEKLLKDFRGQKNWLRGAGVDKLSEEEAEIVADRLVSRINAKTPLIKEKSKTLEREFTRVFKKWFTQHYSSSAINNNEAKMVEGREEKIKNELVEVGEKYLNETEMNALKEAIALGRRPTEDESKNSKMPLRRRIT